MDDIVQFGWSSLTRVQQIGVKFYDEFQQKIPRREVECIADTIFQHASRIIPGCTLHIVGGYRRGKEHNGDVDVIISHPDELDTCNLVERLVSSLESTGCITHILTLSLQNSERGQTPVRGTMSEGGSGFDTLDKALVVWQSCESAGRCFLTNDEIATSQVQVRESVVDPVVSGPHRRVDIIVSPWKTLGCALLGWTGGTTFQRDLRRYCKGLKGLKFDSSGIRSRKNGAWVDLEGGSLGQAPDALTAEKRVFRGLELEWQPPEMRCTG